MFSGYGLPSLRWVADVAGWSAKDRRHLMCAVSRQLNSRSCWQVSCLYEFDSSREATSLRDERNQKRQKGMGGTNETMAGFSMAVTSNSELGGRGRKASEFMISDVRGWPMDKYGQRSDTHVAHRVGRLRRTELPVDTVELARYLIGKALVHDLPGGRVSGRIVETEAYVVGDKAGHAFRGPTPYNQTLYLQRGYAYVYLIYGLHYLLNVTSERVGIGAGVLLRALEPLDGVALMRRSRGRTRLVDLTRGPGRLTNALRINGRHDGVDLCGGGPLWLGTAPRPTDLVGRSVRIGITKEARRLLRFYEQGNPFLSGPKQ